MRYAARSIGLFAGGLRVVILERAHLKLIVAQGADGRHRCLGAGQCGDAGDGILHGGAANGALVVKRHAPERRVDDQIDAQG